MLTLQNSVTCSSSSLAQGNYSKSHAPHFGGPREIVLAAGSHIWQNGNNYMLAVPATGAAIGLGVTMAKAKPGFATLEQIRNLNVTSGIQGAIDNIFKQNNLPSFETTKEQVGQAISSSNWLTASIAGLTGAAGAGLQKLRDRKEMSGIAYRDSAKEFKASMRILAAKTPLLNRAFKSPNAG